MIQDYDFDIFIKIPLLYYSTLYYSTSSTTPNYNFVLILIYKLNYIWNLIIWKILNILHKNLLFNEIISKEKYN